MGVIFCTYYDLMGRCKWYVLFCACILLGTGCWEGAAPVATVDWPDYQGGPARNQYSPLTQITADNVNRLEVAWTYAAPDSGQIQTNPLMVDGVLYGVTPAVQAFALDAATGVEQWVFGDTLRHWASTSRGVSYWARGDDRRILYTVGPYLYALDAATGKPIGSFGDEGRIDLHTGLPETDQDKFIISNTPGTVFEDLIIMPVRVSEGADAAAGDVRAFSVVTGELAWRFRTIPHPGETGYDSWPAEAYRSGRVGAANNWAGMAVDTARGLLFVPTGSAAYDFYGGNRRGDNLFANCLLALDARTGQRRWHFQFTHHDIWDRDLPAPPNLLTIERNGVRQDVVAQITKHGYVFVFDRENGEPVYSIEERPVPASSLSGERTAATQPFPVRPAPFARQSEELTPEHISPYAPDREKLVEELARYSTEVYAPGDTVGAVLLPGYDGGAEWGGAAVDPKGILYVNSNEMPWIHRMKAAPPPSALAEFSPGKRLFTAHCASCHQGEGTADGRVPSLVGVEERFDRAQLFRLISNGRGMMPGFTSLTEEERRSVVGHLLGEESSVAAATPEDDTGWLPYLSTGYNRWLDGNGLPAINPPWGTLSAIDLNTGDYRWQIPLGSEPALAEKGIFNTGTENYGGPVVTGSGLLFIAATKDGYFRAFRTSDGALLWETKLPAAGFATPSVYAIDGRQYIVVACGGTKLGTAKGNSYVAFTLGE